MPWISLATRLGLHIALGYLFCLLVLGPAPVGKFFYKLAGWTAAVAAAVAGLLALAAGWPDPPAEQLRVGATLATVLPAPWYAGNRPHVRRRGLLVAVLAGLIALAAQAFGPTGLGVQQLLGDLAGAAVAGGACFAMVFGHGYLTVPDLPIEHLQRVNRFLTGSIATRLLLATTTLAFAWPRLSDPFAERPLDAFDWLDLVVRFLVGLLVPLAFALMVGSSLRWRNTQSATGILYALTILVWIGEAVALNLSAHWGVAL